MKEREIVKAFDVNQQLGYYETNHDEPYNIPPQARSEISSAMARMPSFLSEHSESTEALRSLYLPTETCYSESTAPKQSEDGPPTEMDSPRLSILSESSFLSIYGDKTLCLDNDVAELEPEATRHRSESVERWIDDRPVSIRPAPSKRASTTHRQSDSHRTQFLSINHVLESPLERLAKLKNTVENNSRLPSTTVSQQAKEKPKTKEMLKHAMTNQTSFDRQHILPPTPDTIGTNTLRRYHNSNDTLDQSRLAEGTFLNSSSTIPAPNSADYAFQSTLSIRPRSAGETVTSRREGHGWDTETQGDDISSLASTSATHESRRRRPLTPELFTYGSDDRHGSWGRDMMFNHESTLPSSHNAARYQRLRQSSGPVHPRNDDTGRHPQHNPNPQNPTTPFETTPRPAPPDRRSSLSATGKFRKLSFSQSPSTNTPIGGSPGFSQESKKKGLGRLFGRSDTSPAVTAPASRGSDMRQNWVDDRPANEDESRATPPPIRRNRNGTSSIHRPNSAGAGASNFAMRRQFAFGGTDGANDVNDGKSQAPTTRGAESIAESEHKTGGRNWLGFSKAGSLRRS